MFVQPRDLLWTAEWQQWLVGTDRFGVLRVDATFKYDDHKPVEHRHRVRR